MGERFAASSSGSFHTALDPAPPIRLGSSVLAALMKVPSSLAPIAWFGTGVAVLLLLQPLLFADEGAMQQGREAMRKRDYDKAIALFSEVIRLNSKDAPAYLERGEALASKREVEKAVADFTTAIALDPKLKKAYYMRAFYVRGEGAYDKAIADYSAIIRLDPNDAEAYRQRGSLHESNAQHDAALADLDRAVQLQPNNEAAYFFLGWCHGRHGELDKAVEDYNNAIRCQPRYAAAFVDRADIYRQKRDYKNAQKDFDAAIAISPTDTRAYIACADLLATCPDAEVRDGKKAVAYAMKACEISGWKTPEAVRALAAAYAEAGEFDNAILWQQKYLDTLGPNGSEPPEARRRLELYKQHLPHHAEK
jgi:tetratricopeptide (TPR) repeat protein